MLIRFTVENFMSFRDEVEFSMIAGKSHIHPDHVVANGKRSSIKLLRAGVIYGANASGKSNLLKAMQFAKDLIVEGTRRKESIAVNPFKFNTLSVVRPSRFEFEFKHSGKAYNYGFRVDAQRVHEEWLYEIGTTSEKMLFERETSPDGDTKVEFGRFKLHSPKDRDFLDFTAQGTRPNQLFLTECAERNMDYFTAIFRWFDEVLMFIFPETWRKGLEIEFITSEDFGKSLQQFFQLFDTGIASIHLKKFNFDVDESIPKQIREETKEKLLIREQDVGAITLRGPRGQRYLVFSEEDKIQALKLMTGHRVDGEKDPVLLDVSEESDGTQRLFDLIPLLLQLFSGEHVVFIDELDRSLHPHLSYKILELFLNTKPEQQSQLIVTTHESALLDLDLLRRDEIWFVEKNPEGASSVYSLEEFAPRYDKDIRKGYLLGRFGAIPVMNADKLDWAI